MEPGADDQIRWTQGSLRRKFLVRSELDLPPKLDGASGATIWGISSVSYHDPRLHMQMAPAA